MSLTIERQFQITTADHGRKTVAPAQSSESDQPKPEPEPVGRIPRITRLMALAIKLDGYVRDGLVTDYAELARLGRVTRARITQIMDLNLLVPDIQEAILGLPRTIKGRDAVRERHVRPIAAEVDWARQREMWKEVRTRSTLG